MSLLWKARVAVLSTVLVFAVITLGVSSDFIQNLTEEDVATPDYAGFSVAVSVLTLVVFTPMCVHFLIRYLRDSQSNYHLSTIG